MLVERIAVFGGEGNMGRTVVREAISAGHQVRVVDPRAKEQVDPENAIRWSTVVYLSLFPNDIRDVLDRYSRKMVNGQMVIENASVKTPLIPILKELDKQGISICSTHPLAKHDQPLRGVKALVMDVGLNSPRARSFVENFYRGSGMIVINHQLDEHDNVMAPEQGFPHILWRTVDKTIADKGYRPEDLWKLAPANAELS